ncbi:MAG: nuclear transport factor 2 family protein [Vicinamibacteria bacterium]
MRKQALLLAALFLVLSTFSARADDKGDVQALIDEYCRLEGIDLAAQAKLMTDDRIMVSAGRRQTDQATNMKVQIAGAKQFDKLDPGGQIIVTAVDPVIRVYGDTAVASFYRFWDYIPSAEYMKESGDDAPSGPSPNIVTLVLVKQGGAWKIVHTHMSALHPST